MWWMIETNKYWYSMNATSATLQFQPKLYILYKNLCLDDMFIITDPGVHKTDNCSI